MRSVFLSFPLFFTFLPLLSGCTNGIDQSSKNSTAEEIRSIIKKSETIIEEMQDKTAIYPILQTTKNNMEFQIIFSQIPEDFCYFPKERVENSLMVFVPYKGFSGDQINKVYQLKFAMISERGEKSDIILHSEKSPVEGSRIFIISKKDFQKFSDAKFINYYMKINTETIEGEFDNNSISLLKNCCQKLLNKRSSKIRDIERAIKNSQTEFNPFRTLFENFEILNGETSKKDIEDYFKVVFTNKVKDPSTNAYEEIISPTLNGENLGPMIVGFNEDDKLVYIRDFCTKAITWLND